MRPTGRLKPSREIHPIWIISRKKDAEDGRENNRQCDDETYRKVDISK
jgi:hypothetical protein